MYGQRTKSRHQAQPEGDDDQNRGMQYPGLTVRQNVGNTGPSN
jgi:hypothetical protein